MNRQSSQSATSDFMKTVPPTIERILFTLETNQILPNMARSPRYNPKNQNPNGPTINLQAMSDKGLGSKLFHL